VVWNLAYVSREGKTRQRIMKINRSGKNIMAETIPREEWDFSECPPNEAHDCWAWEYSRECKLIQEDVSQLRKRKRKKTFDAYFKSISMDIFKGKPGRAMHSFYFCPEFPEKPYLSVSSKERERRQEVLCGLKKEAMAATIDAHDLIPYDIGSQVDRAFRTGEPINQIGSNELVMLRINWAWPDNTLKDQFAAWLKKNRPKDVKQRVQGNDGPARQMKCHLKDLGVWRLLNVMDYTDAVPETEEVLGKSLYKDSTAWDDSKKRACDMLEAFTQSEVKRLQRATRPQ
jgi:hypothetical protein